MSTVTLDFSKAKPLPTSGVQLDFSKAQPIQPLDVPRGTIEPPTKTGPLDSLANYAAKNAANIPADQPAVTSGIGADFGQAGNRFIQNTGRTAVRDLAGLPASIANALMHPTLTPKQSVQQMQDRTEGSQPVNPASPLPPGTVGDYISGKAGGIGAAAITGELASPIINSAFPESRVQGQNYTPSNAASFEGALAKAPAMGKQFVPQEVTPQALSPLRDTLARLQAGTPEEQAFARTVMSRTEPVSHLSAVDQLIQRSLTDLEDQHRPALAAASALPADTSSIVNALNSKISPTMDPADVNGIQGLISRTRNAKTIGDLNRFRQEMNTQNSPIYKMGDVQAGRTGLYSQAVDDLTGNVRDSYYQHLQDASGTDFTPLKRQEANLLTVKEAIQNKMAPLANAEAEFHAPTSLREKAGNIANVIKEPRTTVTQTLLRESPGSRVSRLLRESMTNLPDGSNQ